MLESWINLFHLSIGSLIPIAIVSALSIVLINFLGSKAGGILQSVTLVIKLIPIIIVIVIFGIFQSGDITFSLIPTTGNSGNGFFTAIGSALLATMFAYDGWIHVGNVAGNVKILKTRFTFSDFSWYRLYYGCVFIN